MPFDGQTYDRDLDKVRLTIQLERVRDFMLDSAFPGWRTLAEISEACDAPEPSCSARLRDLRKKKFGGWTISRQRVPNGNGLHRYKIGRGEESANV